MAAADLCSVTACFAAVALCAWKTIAASFFDTQRAARPALGSWYPGVNQLGSCRHPVAPLAGQISPGKHANCPCTNAAFTVGVEPLGFAVMCQLASCERLSKSA